MNCLTAGWLAVLTAASALTPRNAMTWSTHSRRIDPINLSAKEFCHDKPGAMGFVADAHGS
jgi:hypothetical protein